MPLSPLRHQRAVETNPKLMRNMVALLQEFSGSSADRQRIYDWAHHVFDGRSQDNVFDGHPTAEVVFFCLWNILDCDPRTDEPLVRKHDTEAYLRWLLSPAFPARDLGHFVALNFSFDELARRVKVTPVRELVSGWGWLETVQFASLVTGMSFVSFRSISSPVDHDNALVFFEQSADRYRALIELFETLEIDLADVKHMPIEVTPQWVLLRQDDNGNRFVVEHFVTGSAARRRLAQFESMSHKQMYWVEPIESLPERLAQRSGDQGWGR